MGIEKKKKVNKQIKNRWKTVIKVLLLVVFICIVSISVFLIYLQWTTFDITYQPKAIETFLEDENLKETFITTGNEVELIVPINVINTELTKNILKMDLPSYFEIYSVQFDTDQGRLNVNSTIYGFQFPFSCSLTPTLTGSTIVIDIEDIALGGKGIVLSESICNRLKASLFNASFPITLETSTLGETDLVKVSNFEMVSDGYNVDLEINQSMVIDTLKKIKVSANDELLTQFENSDDLIEQTAAEYINNANDLSPNDIEVIIEDALLNAEIISNIILLADLDVIDEIFKSYNEYLDKVDKDNILAIKESMLSDILYSYYYDIFDALDNNYFAEEFMYINKGKPYAFSNKEEVTIKKIVNETDIEIQDVTIDKLAFIYDMEDKKLMISYNLDENNYLILNEDDEEIIDAITYHELYGILDTGEANRVTDKLLWESIYSTIIDYFSAEKVYIRYMDADDKYAFVVASPDYDYQNYWVFALEKENDSWFFLEDDLTSVGELNESYPEFNLDTATIEIDTITMYNLDNDMQQVILKDMSNKGIIDDPSNYSIEYCSYGNQYIDFRLSNGKEYVYLVYSMYLHTVYEKSVAINYWEDIPNIIMLQDKPE